MRGEHISRAQRFLSRLLMSACQELLLPSPVNFALQALRDFKEIYLELSQEERATLASELRGERAQVVEAVRARLSLDGWLQGRSEEGVNELIHLICEVMMEAPSASQLLSSMSAHAPERWRSDQGWARLSLPSRVSYERRVAHRALAQTWVAPLLSARDEQNARVELPPPELPGLMVHPTLLGQGGRSVVYHATPQDHRWRQLAEQHGVSSIALKVGVLESATRFHREVEVMRSTWGDHLCPALDAGVLEPSGVTPRAIARYWIAMPNYGGLTLAHLIEQGEPLEVTLSVMLTCLEALCVLHERGVVHRDLKPANLLITADLSAKLSDFGLARSVERAGLPSQSTGVGLEDVSGESVSGEGVEETAQREGALAASATQTQLGELVGTPAYMSPEQLSLDKKVGMESDVWSYGVMLYEVLTGERLFPQEGLPELWGAILHQELTLTHPSLTSLTPELRALLKECLKREVSERPSSALPLKRRFEATLRATIQRERFERFKRAWLELLKRELITTFIEGVSVQPAPPSTPNELLNLFHESLPEAPEVDNARLCELLWRSLEAHRALLNAESELRALEATLPEQLSALEREEVSRVERFTSSFSRDDLIKRSDEISSERSSALSARQQAQAALHKEIKQQKERCHKAKRARDSVLPNALKEVYPSFEAWRAQQGRLEGHHEELKALRARLEQLLSSPERLLTSTEAQPSWLIEGLAPTLEMTPPLKHTQTLLFQAPSPKESALTKSRKELLKGRDEGSLRAELLSLQVTLEQNMCEVRHTLETLEQRAHELDSEASLGELQDQQALKASIQRQTTALETLALELEGRAEVLSDRLKTLAGDELLKERPPPLKASASLSAPPALQAPSRPQSSAPTAQEGAAQEGAAQDAQRVTLITRVLALIVTLLAHPSLWLPLGSQHELTSLGGLWGGLALATLLSPRLVLPTLWLSLTLILSSLVADTYALTRAPLQLLSDGRRGLLELLHLTSLPHELQQLWLLGLGALSLEPITRWLREGRSWWEGLLITLPSALCVALFGITLSQQWPPLGREELVGLGLSISLLLKAGPYLIGSLLTGRLLQDLLSAQLKSPLMTLLMGVYLYAPVSLPVISLITLNLSALDQALVRELLAYISLIKEAL